MKNKKTILTIATILIFSLMISSANAIERTIFIKDYEIKYAYNEAKEGETFTLTVYITNIGRTNKTDISLQLEDRRPFKIKGSDTFEVGNLNPGEKKTGNFRIEIDEEIPEDKYDLDFTLKEGKKEYDDNFEIDIKSDKADLIIGQVSSTPLLITAGQSDIKLAIRIENIGGGDATFVRAKLELPEGTTPSTSYSDTANIGTIKSKGNAEATFYIDTQKNLKAGSHKGFLNLEFKSGSETRKEKLEFDIPIKGSPQFIISSVKTEPKTIYSGSSANQLTIKVQNVGQEKGEETSVRVFENADFPIKFDQKTNFIGTVETGKEGLAAFKFNIDKEAKEKTYLLKIQTRTLNKGNILVEEHTVPITVVKDKKNIIGNSLVWIIPALIAVFIVLLTYKYYKKPNKKQLDDF